MSRVLVVLREHLEAGGFSAALGGRRHIVIPINDISYHDDLVIPCVAPANELVDKTAAIASITFEVFIYFGFRLNFTRGKTEASAFFCR